LTATPIPIYRSVIVIDGTSIEWVEDPKVSSYCFILYFLHGSGRGRRDSFSRPAVVVELVVMEEEVVLRRGPSVLRPFRGVEEEYYGVGTPSVPIYTNSNPLIGMRSLC
jgi:hypothetical protein